MWQNPVEANEWHAVGDLCDVDPCAKPGFQWWWEKKDVGKDWAVRLSASSPGMPRMIQGRRGAPQELNALSNELSRLAPCFI